jgi:cytochrome c-type biogenesis protein CcmH/NrfG
MPLLILLILLPFIVFNDAFQAGFEVPKVLAVYVLGAACLAFLAPRPAIVLPARPVQQFLAAFAAVVLVSGLMSPVTVSLVPALAMFISLTAVYLFVLNAGEHARTQLLLALLILAVIEAVIGLAQAVHFDAWLPGYLLHGRRTVIGTLGNEEFLATLLGVAFFIAQHFYRQPVMLRGQRPLCALAMTLMLGGLVLAHNKGGLLFIALTFIWRWQPRAWVLAGVTVAGAALLIWLFPDQAKGRVLLWLAALAVFGTHVVGGIGPGQFENGYLDAVHALFTRYPVLAEYFATNSAKVQDAHNIVLNQTAELGVAGLVLSVVFVIYGVRLARRHGGALGTALLWLLFKSLYTVVLGAATSALLLAIMLAMVTPRETATAMVRVRAHTLAMAAMLLPLFAGVWVVWSDYLYQRGLRAMMVGELTVAEARFRESLRHHPQNGDVWLALAQLHYQQHDAPSMKAELQKAIALKKEINVVKIAAHTYFFSGNYDEARELYRYLHTVYPGHLTTMTRLALIALRRADYTEASLMAQAVLDGRPSREVWSDSRNRATARQILQQIETVKH